MRFLLRQMHATSYSLFRSLSTVVGNVVSEAGAVVSLSPGAVTAVADAVVSMSPGPVIAVPGAVLACQ